MAKIKQVYVSRDGKEFESEVEADAHERSLDMQENIEKYIVASGLQKAQAGLMRKHLPAFATFVETGYVAPVETKPAPEAQADPAPETPARSRKNRG